MNKRAVLAMMAHQGGQKNGGGYDANQRTVYSPRAYTDGAYNNGNGYGADRRNSNETTTYRDGNAYGEGTRNTGTAYRDGVGYGADSRNTGTSYRGGYGYGGDRRTRNMDSAYRDEGSNDGDRRPRSMEREHGSETMKARQAPSGEDAYLMDGGKNTDRIDRRTAEEWVENMKSSDQNHQTGGKWAPQDIKPLAQKLNIPETGEKFWEFYAMMNAMYSDYAPVAKKFGITSPEFYACMAKAWMDDKDANPDKTALYYRYIVQK